jgi:regulatory protein
VLDTDAGLEQALETAYRYLNSRERTEAEMRAHLQGKDIGERAVERTIRALVEQGQLDDTRFARLFVQDKRELDGWGVERIRQVLLSRGVDRDVVEGAVADAAPDEEMSRALELLRRRFPLPARDRRDRDRALGVLVRKGFDPDLALEALAIHGKDADPR